MAIIKINDVELEFNILEADTAEKFENAFTQVVKRVKDVQANKTLRLSQGIREICETVSDCFDTLFGDGTSNKIFGNTCDMGRALEVFAQLKNQFNQTQTKLMDDLNSKYKPNRATRRAKK